MLRRSVLAIPTSGLLSLSAAAQGPAPASAWPTRTVRLLVGFAPGGTADILARRLAGPLSRRLGQTVVVENKPGASGVTAAAEIARSAAEGHSFGLAVSTHASLAAISQRLPFDTERDFAPVVFVGSIPFVLVVGRNSLFGTLQDLVSAAKAKPGTLNYGMPGTGLAHHFAGELLKQRTGTDIVAVSYRGTAPALNDVIAGQVEMTFATLPAVMGAIEGGTVKALAITAPQRSESLPQVPTVAESGYPGFEIAEWFGLIAPASMPAAAVERINTETNAVLTEPELQAWMRQNNVIRGSTTSDGFRALITAEIRKLTGIAQAAHVSLD